MSANSINTFVHFVQQLPLINQITLQERFTKKLNQWANEALLSTIENQNRAQAQSRFLEFMHADQDSLVLSHLGLNSLPNIFDFEFFQRKLKDLDLSHNNLQALPGSFSHLQELRCLDLDANRFTSFPRCLNNLARLNRVSLASNNLSNLQGFLSDNLERLTRLDFGYNHSLSSFPMSILQLSPNCIVNFAECGLSQGFLRRVGAEIMTSSYTGPLINFSWNDQIEEKTIETSLRDLYRKANQPLTTFPSAEEGTKLRSWLNRLSSMIDYQKEDGIQKTLANKIIGYLNLIREDCAFRDVFYEIIEDASGSCGDRMSLSILYLEIAYQLMTIDIEDMKALSHFLLKGPWTLEMLGKLARDKIDSLHFIDEIDDLRFFDEIEVYLGYPIKLILIEVLNNTETE